MRRLVINLDDDLDLWLSKQTNQNEIVRDALRLYKSDIATDTVKSMRATWLSVDSRLKSLEQKLDYISTTSQQGPKEVTYTKDF